MPILLGYNHLIIREHIEEKEHNKPFLDSRRFIVLEGVDKTMKKLP